MFCQKCGNPLQPGERFCTKCGAPAEQQPAAPQQPQQAYQAPQQAPYQQPYQQPYQAPKAPMAKNKLFGLLTMILFGTAALFELVSMIGLCAVGGAAGAGFIISSIVTVLACVGIALAPLFKQYTKLCVTASAAGLFIGIYGLSIMGINGSVGFLFYMLGFAALALLCWLVYNGNHFAKQIWVGFIPAGVIFLGALLNWIIGKYFTMMKYATVYYLFAFLFDVVIIGASVILAFYLVEIFEEKGVKFSIPNPGAQPQRPQQPPYQGR